MNDQLKIKFVFVGNRPIKKPELLNNVLCVYLNSGRSFLLARENRPVFEYLLNTKNKKDQLQIVELLKNNSFYEFVGSVPKIKEYCKLFDSFNGFEKIDHLEKVLKNFEKWTNGNTLQKQKAIDGFSKEIKQSILKEYFTNLNVREPKPVKPTQKKRTNLTPKSKVK